MQVLPEPPPELAVEHGLFSVRQALAAGSSRADITRNIRRQRWVRVEPGILMATGHQQAPLDPLLLAALRAGPGAVVARRSAASAFGWDLLDVPAMPEIIVPRRCTRSAKDLIRSDLRPDEVTVHGLLLVTTPDRTVLDLARILPTLEAVVAVDSAYRSGEVTPASSEVTWRDRRSLRGHRQARRVLDLASPLSGSVPESEFRVRVALSGLPLPLCQFVVTVDGRFVARVDFAWPDLRLIVEIDGFAYHSSPTALQNDHERLRALTRAGWRVLPYTADDVRKRPEDILEEIRAEVG